jgi:hypothetical protein
MLIFIGALGLSAASMIVAAVRASAGRRLVHEMDRFVPEQKPIPLPPARRHAA